MTDLDRYLPAIAAGDADAFGHWLAGAEPPLRASLRSFASVIDTEAALQEALLLTWNHAPRVRADGRPNALLRWARRTLRNHAIDRTRKRHPDWVDPHTGPAPVVEPIEPQPWLREVLQRCQEALPPAPARALAARLEAHGARHDRELARACGMQPNTFLKNVGRAKQLLRTCLERAGHSLELP